VTEPHLRIGPFSRASSLSIKALRAYHEQGLLVPALVDPDTGYRVYAASQLLDAAVLRRLRELDVPLRQIREVLEARDPAVTGRVLAQHARAMQQRLDDTARIVDELQRGVDAPTVHTPVHLRDEPARDALVLDVRAADGVDFTAFVADAIARLRAAADELGAATDAAPCLLFPQQIDDDDAEDAVACLPLPGPVVVPGGHSARLGEIPASAVAVATHLGGYDDIADTYRRLGRWVAEHAEPRPLDVREHYLVGPPAPDGELVTEIQWPVVEPTRSRAREVAAPGA
jgi:DNA-binding transcriptional MerR regulator